MVLEGMEREQECVCEVSAFLTDVCVFYCSAFAPGIVKRNLDFCNSQLALHVYLSMDLRISKVVMVLAASPLKRREKLHNYPRRTHGKLGGMFVTERFHSADILI